MRDKRDKVIIKLLVKGLRINGNSEIKGQLIDRLNGENEFTLSLPVKKNHLGLLFLSFESIVADTDREARAHNRVLRIFGQFREFFR